MQQASRPNVLSIAGSDGSGGAGVQADLKTFAAHGVHGLSAIAALTAQNTRTVAAIQAVSSRMLALQLDTLADEFRIDAVKIGMLGSRAAIRCVVRFLRDLRPAHVVLDPVLRASAGPALLPPQALAALRDDLLPMATLVTPNLPEASILLEGTHVDIDTMEQAARQIQALGAGGVLLKGGHLPHEHLVDLLVTGGAAIRYAHPRQPVQARGTGCTLASAIAARLALGDALPDACRGAIDYLQAALAVAYWPGRGHAVAVLEHGAGRPGPCTAPGLNRA